MSKGNFIRPLPSTECLRDHFTYDRASGDLRWKKRPRDQFKSARDYKAWNTLYAEKLAGTILSNGYLSVRLFGVRYNAHRVIYKLVTGEDPSETIDHIDRDPNNNRWANLRVATYAQQQHNQPRQKNNTSGFVGVSRQHGKWRAEIGVDWKSIHLGSYETKEEAAAVRRLAERRIRGKFYKKDGEVP